MGLFLPACSTAFLTGSLRPLLSLQWVGHLKVLAINGYYDLATPFFAAEYTFKHMGLEKRIQDNFTLKYYEAGHMMYIDPASGKQFKKDIATFIKETTK